MLLLFPVHEKRKSIASKLAPTSKKAARGELSTMV